MEIFEGIAGFGNLIKLQHLAVFAVAAAAVDVVVGEEVETKFARFAAAAAVDFAVKKGQWKEKEKDCCCFEEELRNSLKVQALTFLKS